MNARMYQQALDDIDKALSLSPNNPDYLLHKSSVNLVVSQIDECISAARKCIQLKPDMAQAYRILGYALLQKGDKNGARTNLERAKSLGDESAQEIMDMYLK
jgi:Flp pilus assembly protein TadD